MDVITIPQRVIKNDDLVIIPRKQYEQFLGIVKRQGQLDSDLNEAIGQVRRGKGAGPFCSVGELKKSLEK
ncbi:MAG: hypothetical protein Q8N55_03065 [bacterium]|nr:hypothetical protein [bacterium]